MSPRRTVEEALQTRASVLDAAFAAARRGAGRFTIDAVAREAGVTKGAVLHHFPSKEALAGAMLERELDAFEAAIERNLAQEPEGMVGRWLRAYARASFEAGVPHAGVSEAVLAGVASDTGVLSSYEARCAAWREKAMEDGLLRARAEAVRLAVDGAATAEMFGLLPREGAERNELLQELLDLTRRA